MTAINDRNISHRDLAGNCVEALTHTVGAFSTIQAGRQPAWPDYLRGQIEQPIRVLLVDDDPHVCHVIVQDLMGDMRINFLAETGNLREARKLLARHTCDVLLLDLNLEDGSGLDLIEHARHSRPGLEVIVISCMEDEHQVMRAFELGATGYLVKNSWFGTFAQAVLQVVNGGASITPQLARRLLHRMGSSRNTRASAPVFENEKLTDREHTVLRMIACGNTSTEAGRHLGISVQTVNSHIKNIYRKLRVRNRAQAVNYAHAQGML